MTSPKKNMKELTILYLQLMAEKQIIENKLKEGCGGSLLTEYFFIDDLINDLKEILGENFLNWAYSNV